MRSGLVSKPSWIPSNVAIMCDNVSAIAYLRNQHGHRYLRMGRKTVHDTDTQTSPWAFQCVCRSYEPQRSDSEIRMESESSRSTTCLLGSSQVDLIRQTLNKLILHRAELILIAPLWPKQEWFPDLLRLSIYIPLVLPPTAKLLKQSFLHHFHQRPQFLNLHAWRLSVDPIKLEDFRNKCPTGSLFLKKIHS